MWEFLEELPMKYKVIKPIPTQLFDELIDFSGI